MKNPRRNTTIMGDALSIYAQVSMSCRSSGVENATCTVDLRAMSRRPRHVIAEHIVRTRLQNPAITFPAVRAALLQLRRVADDAGLAATTRLLVEVRASQINGCGVCLDMHTRELRAAGQPTAKIDTIAAWRETPYFTDDERAALALTEAETRLAEPSAISDEAWNLAATYYTDAQLAALVIAIATINAWNRIMVATGQITGDWVEHVIEQDHRR